LYLVNRVAEGGFMALDPKCVQVAIVEQAGPYVALILRGSWARRFRMEYSP
jgi:hypothetical protein